MSARDKLVTVVEQLVGDIGDALYAGAESGADAQAYATALYMLDSVLSNSESRANIQKLMERTETTGGQDLVNLASQILAPPKPKKPTGGN